MKFIIKLHPEITIKSDAVRRRFNKLLGSNIRSILRNQGYKVGVQKLWDRLEVNLYGNDAQQTESAIASMQRVPGVHSIVQVNESTFTDLEDIFQQVKAVWQHKLVGKSFAVRVKRKGKQPFSSLDIARYVGGGLNQFCDTGGVKLKEPDIEVNLMVDDDILRLVDKEYTGLGGLPLPTQEDVLSLISGGFDSGVSTYELIRRGARTHYCFFNLGGVDHEVGVREVSHFIWQQFSYSHRVKFVAVNFEPVVNEILEKIDNGLMGVVLKRMMIRAASLVADKLNIKALVTGEALGQVSSQTLTNLHVIDQVTDKLVLRPLICQDKTDIIHTAQKIGTEAFAKKMPEYCGVISNNPNAQAPLDKVIEAEANFDFTLIDRVVEASFVEDIRTVVERGPLRNDNVEVVSTLNGDEVVLDIRSPEEEDANPLELENVEVMHLPFFRLERKFPKLDQSKFYALYCDRGVMSKIQAGILNDSGFSNVKVYRP